jgi:dihydrofolate synthase/folylpolyglutamate synthase
MLRELRIRNLAVIEEVCAAREAPLTLLGRDVRWCRGDVSSEAQEVQVEGVAGERPFEHLLRIPLLGAHQLENAAAVITALEWVRIQGHPVPYDGIYLGLAGVEWPGRLERVRESPQVVVDGAHNTYSAARLREAMREYFSYDRLLLVLGVSTDKDLPGIVRELAPGTAWAIATRSRHPRSAEPAAIAQELEAHQLGRRAAPTVAEALDQALLEAQARDLVLVTGSLFVVAEARERLLGIQPEIYSF